MSLYFSGSLIESYGTRFVFGVIAVFLFMIVGVLMLV